MYRSMLTGLSSASIFDLGPTAAQGCRPAMSVSTYVGKPVLCHYHSNLGQTVEFDCRPVYRSMLGGLSYAGISDLGPAAAYDCPPAMPVSTYVGKRIFCQYQYNLGQTVA